MTLKFKIKPEKIKIGSFIIHFQANINYILHIINTFTIFAPRNK